MNTEEAIEKNDYKRWNIQAVEKFTSDEEARNVINLAQRGNSSAMERMVCANVPLLSKYARSYSRRGSNFDDLFSEGCVAIIQAVNNFDLKGSITVGTALITAITTRMKRYVGVDKNVRISIQANFRKTKIHAILERLKKEEKNFSVVEIASESGLSEKVVEKLLKIDTAVVSMNVRSEGKESEGDEFGDTLVSDVQSPYESVEKADNYDFMMKAIEKLSSIEKVVIEFRYGLNGKEVSTLEEIAKVVNYTRERVRQIENNAIKKMHRMAMA